MSKILILSSNPRGDLLNLDREIRDLKAAIKRLGKFEVEDCLAVRSQELKKLIAENSPQIVHFCGHGAGDQGLVFQDDNGREQLVSTEVIAEIFEVFSPKYEKNPVNCVVLNAGDRYRQAEAIVEHINYVVGMSQLILDKAAYLFSLGFYAGLAAEKSIEQAYKLGCLEIRQWIDETKSQSTQSSPYRKLEHAGDAVQPAQTQLAEYMKPVLLKKSERFPPPLSALSGPSQEFVEYSEKEDIGWIEALKFGVGDGLIAVLLFALVCSSGRVCIQHFTLRFILKRNNCIPKNYVKFLDFASDRLLMKKVGGGYVFFHRMLLEYFARMQTN